MDHEMFETSEASRDAVERCIERVCEAPFRLGEHAEELMLGQPWSDIRSMGNRLRQAYNSVNVKIVWKTAFVRLPELAIAARHALVHQGWDR